MRFDTIRVRDVIEMGRVVGAVFSVKMRIGID